jgi:hypothetical protein
MTALLVVVAVVAIALLVFGGLVPAVQWLLWVGIILLVLAVFVWLIRMFTGRRHHSV